MLLVLLKAKCRVMPAYYLKQLCKLNFSKSYTGSNIHILNLTCSPDITKIKSLYPDFPKNNGLCDHTVFLLMLFCLPPKTFWPIWPLTKYQVTMKKWERTSECALWLSQMEELCEILADINLCVEQTDGSF